MTGKSTSGLIFLKAFFRYSDSRVRGKNKAWKRINPTPLAVLPLLTKSFSAVPTIYGSRLSKSVCRMDGIGFYRKSLLPKKVSLFFHYIISVFILFVFLLLRFCDCGSSYAPVRGNKTLHGPMLLESRLFCSNVMRSLYFFLNSKLRCTSLEICKNTVR